LLRAIYPGSFDPVTNGHVDIAARAAKLFETLIVGVYDAPPKRLLFSTEERVAMMQEALRNVPNVRVEGYSGLTIDFARRVNAQVMVRGLRVVSDFEREMQLALANKKLGAEIETVCIMTDLNAAFLSSSLIKEIASLGGKVEEFVPPHVAAALRRAYGV
jgi:pantetheine-phosphate adenylyltransferase